MKDFVGAAVQMTSGQNWEKNWETAKKQIQKAANEGANLIVLPENFIIFDAHSYSYFCKKNNPISDKIRALVSATAKDFGIYIIAGTIPVCDYKDQDLRPYAASFVFDDQGNEVARYNKIHLFDALVDDGIKGYKESNIFRPGSSLTCIETPFCKMGVAVCYDLRFPEMFRLLASQNIDIVVLSSAFTEPTGAAHWMPLLKARAIENQIFIIAASQEGWHSKIRRTHGHSAILSPWGDLLAIKERGEGVICAKLEKQHLEAIQKKMPVKNHQRFFVDSAMKDIN